MTTVAPVSRQPLQENQYQQGITEGLTGLVLDEHLCAICSKNRSIAVHHIVYRSRGGTQGPTVTLCQECHDHIHREEWRLDLEDNGMQVVDKATDETIWRLKAWPEALSGIAGSAGDFVAQIDSTNEALLRYMPMVATALLPYQALEIFRAVRETESVGWKAQACLLQELYHYRFPGRTNAERIEALCDAFAIRKSQCYNLLSIAEAFCESPLLQESGLSMGYFIEAARATEPEAWLRLAEERKLAMPSFSRDDLREEIKASGGRKLEPEPTEGGETTKSHPQVWARCSECGHIGFHEKLPRGSTGEPVDLASYR